MKNNDEIQAFHEREMEEFRQNEQLKLIVKWALYGVALGAAYFLGTTRCAL